MGPVFRINSKRSAVDDFPLVVTSLKMVDQPKLEKLKEFARTNLGEDMSSDHFMKRKKSIAFVYVINNEVHRLDQDYFIQHESYNDFSGGYKRNYKLIPRDIVVNLMSDIIIQFKDRFNIPDKTLLLIQIQTSISNGTNQNSTRERSDSITGQGIHTDGLCEAMISCIERSNVEGAENSFYNDLQGNEQLGNGICLEEGDAVFFQDNRIFHKVSRARNKDRSLPMRRTVLLIHSPAEELLTGLVNPRNTQGTNRTSSFRLRDMQSTK